MERAATSASFRRRLLERVNWQLLDVGGERVAAALAQPHGDRDAVVALAGEVPVVPEVLDPLDEALPHP